MINASRRKTSLKRKRRGASRRNAFTLLEVILSIAILAGSVSVLGELGRISLLNAQKARDLARAQILCETKLAEIASGSVVVSSDEEGSFDETYQLDDMAWSYSISTSTIDSYGMSSYTVTVTQSGQATGRPVSYSLTRWLYSTSTTSSSSTSTSLSN